MKKDKIKEAIDNLYTDLLMLEDGDWVPDRHSIGASIESLVIIATELNFDHPQDTREV